MGISMTVENCIKRPCIDEPFTRIIVPVIDHQYYHDIDAVFDNPDFRLYVYERPYHDEPAHVPKSSIRKPIYPGTSTLIIDTKHYARNIIWPSGNTLKVPATVHLVIPGSTRDGEELHSNTMYIPLMRLLHTLTPITDEYTYYVHTSTVFPTLFHHIHVMNGIFRRKDIEYVPWPPVPYVKIEAAVMTISFKAEIAYDQVRDWLNADDTERTENPLYELMFNDGHFFDAVTVEDDVYTLHDVLTDTTYTYHVPFNDSTMGDFIL